ncbi:MAG TPA: hypothetical protein VKM55_04885 [Candidatus Lokiarchaeia archaeon]|nr:hypothetical protein [Candidatus Lokiarchaeia archaeon]
MSIDRAIHNACKLLGISMDENNLSMLYGVTQYVLDNSIGNIPMRVPCNEG